MVQVPDIPSAGLDPRGRFAPRVSTAIGCNASLGDYPLGTGDRAFPGPHERGLFAASQVIEGDLAIQGDLTVKNVIVYVQGNLAVGGGIQGEGIVVVMGKTRIDTGAPLDSQPDHLVALVCDGDVQIGGRRRRGPATSRGWWPPTATFAASPGPGWPGLRSLCHGRWRAPAAYVPEAASLLFNINTVVGSKASPPLPPVESLLTAGPELRNLGSSEFDAPGLP